MDSETELLSLITQITFLGRSTDSYTVRVLELVSLMTQIIPLVKSMDFDSLPKPESEIISLIKETISLFSAVSETEPESELVSLVTQITSLGSSNDSDEKLMFLVNQISSLKPEPEITSRVYQIMSIVNSANMSLESKLLSLITQLVSLFSRDANTEQESEAASLCKQINTLVGSVDLESLPKPESEAISLIKQIISVSSSVSDTEPEYELISVFHEALASTVDLHSKPEAEAELVALIERVFSLEPKPELVSLITQILPLVNSADKQFISLCPQVEVKLEHGRFRVTGKVQQRSSKKGECYRRTMDFYRIVTGETFALFRCPTCNGEDHEEYDKAPLEVIHFLHPKHSLELVLSSGEIARKCYCCEEYLAEVFYYCPACDYAMNIACFEKDTPLSIDNTKWHEHSLTLFPRLASLACNVCALTHSSCPFYICPPCEFVIHQRCISLPRVIKMSRHLHRISFTPSFDQGDWSCGVCRKDIDTEYGGYSCTKNGCSYAAHSRCATQSNVWDGVELEGVPEDIDEEEVEPFVRISNGIIQHFSHKHHHLRLDENTDIDYKGIKECQACIKPIDDGRIYLCMKCDFILHEACANLSRKIHHPIHAHPITLVTDNSNVMDTRVSSCSACPWLCTGFFYSCTKIGCHFKLHVQCGTISEPLVHESHTHPLFLTSKPGERRRCSVCKDTGDAYAETFNCIEECDFALCFKCATLPHKVRYKHDKHMLSLSYGKEISMGTYWCEVCERKLNPKERFYMCDEYCRVTIHIECLLGVEFYMKVGSSLIHLGRKFDVLRNNTMSRPICVVCKKRCPQNVSFHRLGSVTCSLYCVQ
ncbi:unnamed protein product [Microthlaspi erraticum]|uniref:Phorbol-ester/DAG-type domain-containing protein n=1 Tax=Microthlaspi erraticum TaxID=1685480 RepID=A0A6D2I9R0_9BRAS|nr:unnamed protein product [Microthlaspi erraticum]